MTVLVTALALMLPPTPPPPNAEVILAPRVRCGHSCQAERRAVRRARRLLRYKRRVVRPYNWKLNRMAWCESTGRWFIATGNGFYGGLQFTLRTWWSVGGRGYPNQNSILEQKYRAVLLIRRAGYGPWPVCGFV